MNDYTRKGFVDGRVLRLPTVCVRPGKPNLAASSFVSSIIREPINGETTICPVSEDLPIWMASPNTIIQNFIWAATIDGATFGHHRTVNLPGIGPTVRQMLNALERLTDKATVDRVQFIPDEAISTIVYSWPVAVDNTRGIQLGFSVDEDFDGFIRQFMHQNKA